MSKVAEDVKDYSKVCDYCLDEKGRAHCEDIPGRFRGCHESFGDRATLLLHIHGGTGGCRYPGAIVDFYRKGLVWYKKEPKREESEDPTSR